MRHEATSRRWTVLLWALAPAFLLSALVGHSGELRAFLHILAHASPLWLAGALLLQVGFAVNQGAFYQVLLRMANAPVALFAAVHLALVMAFGSLASPAGTAAGIAFFVAEASGAGIGWPSAVLASLGYYLFDYAMLAVVLVAAVLRVAETYPGHPAGLAVVGLAALSVPAGVRIAWMVARDGARAALPRGRLTDAVRRWFRRLAPRAADRLASLAKDLRASQSAIRARPRDIIRAFGHAAIGQALNLLTLAAAFRALGFHAGLSTLAAAYGAGSLLMIFSVTPAGLGVVEPAMTAVLTALSVPLAWAAAATLLFRACTFWLPMLSGFASLQLGGTNPASRTLALTKSILRGGS